jgi:hypothetical protein
MLHALLPAAALLTHNSAAKAQTKTELSVNTPVAQAKDITQPTNPWAPPIADGTTVP